MYHIFQLSSRVKKNSPDNGRLSSEILARSRPVVSLAGPEYGPRIGKATDGGVVLTRQTPVCPAVSRRGEWKKNLPGLAGVRYAQT